MRIDGKFYGDDAKRAALDALIALSAHPGMFRGMARLVLDTETVGVGWLVGCAPRGASHVVGNEAVAMRVRQDFEVVKLMGRLSRSENLMTERSRALFGVAEKMATLLGLLEDGRQVAPDAVRKLAKDCKRAARAFWKFALTETARADGEDDIMNGGPDYIRGQDFALTGFIA